MVRSVTLTVGQQVHLKQGRDHIYYAGMPSDSTYSIVQVKSSGYRGFSWNLFFPKNRQEITVDEMRILVESVTPEEIRLRIA